MTYLEEASNSCSATLVPVHAGHAASGLDVGAAGVVGNALQEARKRAVRPRHASIHARQESLNPSHLSHQHECLLDGSFSAVLQFDDSGLMTRHSCGRKNSSYQEVQNAWRELKSGVQSTSYRWHNGWRQPDTDIPSPEPSGHSQYPPKN